MSVHPDRYKFLKLHPEWVDSIARMEQRYNGPDGRYLMEQYTSLSQKELSAIHDGDLIAIVTTKRALTILTLALPYGAKTVNCICSTPHLFITKW